MTLTEAATAIRRRQVSARQLTLLCLERIARAQPRLNCFVSLDADKALKTASDADADLAHGHIRGPLHGVPLAHKDLFYRRGHISTCGSEIRRHYVPSRSATVLDRLDKAGAINLGTLHMSEFAMGASGHNAHLGDCRNPWNLEHIPGGSSSGPAAATAARLVYAALGSDTGGSIRLPAACCGLVGLKPTQSRVSRFGVMPLSFSLDSVGTLTRTVRDCTRLMQIIAGVDPKDPTCSQEPVPDYEIGLDEGVTGLRIGVPTDYFYDGVTHEVRVCLEESLGVYRALGATVIPVELPNLARLNDLATIVQNAEASTLHAHWMRLRPQDYSAEVRSRLALGYFIPATLYLEALRLRASLLTEFVEAAFSQVSFLYTPILAVPPPTLESTRFVSSATLSKFLAAMTRLTRPINYLGLPALSIPCGFSANGLPIGFQLIGPPFKELLLLRAGHAYQQVTNWHKTAPTVLT
jgi:aspartyl-tRNA(Asn)/glutamyl-tRNA(Gln) amidotransferase subunit A